MGFTLLISALLGCESAEELDEQADAVELGRSELEEFGASAPIVRVQQGRLQGRRVDDTLEFLGIPYAEPPVGARRFMPPEPKAPWSGTRQAVALGPSCVQPMNVPFAAPGPQSEDCLTLNVYRPARFRANRPVMVFIHGGAFFLGGSVQYDGTRLSEEGDVIVVTLNYRLGTLGFLSHPSLDARRASLSGNDALRDQQLALRWVRRNIGAFGGDPNKVTMFGESAGAISACLHFVAPSSQRLARNIIMQSGACMGNLLVTPRESALARGERLVQELCASATDAAACLLERSAEELALWGWTPARSAGWAPSFSTEDDFMPDAPQTLLANGSFDRRVRVISGSNRDEYAFFQAIGQASPVTSVTALHALIDATFGALAADVKSAYPATDETANAVYVQIMTDYLFRCPARQVARLVQRRGNPVYLYSFEQPPAFHTAELPYVFGAPDAQAGAPVLVEPLRELIQTYWTSFARDGNPNVYGQPSWPRYDATNDRHIVLKEMPVAGSGLARAQCDFWAARLWPNL